ncbi:MAG: tyrosine-type recombinase/integrase [Spirochaetia bacterium]
MERGQKFGGRPTAGRRLPPRTRFPTVAKSNAHGPRGFHFYNAGRDRPCDGEILREGLKWALVDMSLSKKDRENEDKRTKVWEKWSAAGISFHSWRHFFAAHMADRVDMRSLQLATGHKSPTMAAHYAAHASDEHFRGVAQAATSAFTDLMSFGRGAEWRTGTPSRAFVGDTGT